MRDKVLKTIEDYSMLSGGDNIIVALSGGADSVALLHFLNSIKEKYNFNLFACHVNHMIRGEEADADEHFVAQLCSKLGVELFVKKVDVPAIAKEQKTSLELCGRNVRYEFFKELSQKLCAKVATAHTASDNAETVLYNIARGTSITGLCGIRPTRDYIVRPFINVTRHEVEEYCREFSLSFVTDSTNLTDDYTRNNIRHNCVPALIDVNADMFSAVSRMTNSMRELKDFLDNYSLKEVKSAENKYGYSCQKLLDIHPAVLSNAIHLIAKTHGCDIEQTHIELIIKAMNNGGCVDLPCDMRCVCKQGTMRIVSQTSFTYDFECKLKDYEKTEYISKEELTNINRNLLSDFISCDIINEETVIRTRKEGDTFTLQNRGVTKSLKKLFNEMKIPAEQRDRLLVVANDSTVLWIQGIGTSEQGKVTQNSSGAIWVMEGNYDS